MAKTGDAAIFSSNVQWKLKFTGDSTEYVVNGVGSHDTSGGDAPTSEIRSFAGVYQQTGQAPLPSISLEITIYNPTTTVWEKLRAAKLANQSIEASWATQKRSILSGSAALGAIAIAQTDADTTTATATLTAGTTALSFVDRTDIVPGVALVIGSKGYVVDEVLTATTLKVKRAASGAAVASTAMWEFVVPSIGRAYFSCAVGQTDNESMPADGAMTSTLVLNPNAAPPGFSLIDPVAG